MPRRPTYTRLLDRLQPRELLGLTATPERADGLDVLRFFDGRISAELRVWDAIDQQYLVPFAYYGIHDGLDLRDVPFRRGTGYDVGGLTNVFTANHVWVSQIIEQIRRRVGDPTKMRALGFCVGVDHARFMSEQFNRRGIPAQAVWGDTPEAERLQALRDLRDGRLAVVFAVDLFNEGVDVPSVDTLLMLRPTESATLFLQQLGRGLRRARPQGDVHGARLRRPAPQGVPLRPPVPSVARRFPCRPAAAHRARLPVPAGRLPSRTRLGRSRRRARQHQVGGAEQLAAAGGGVALDRRCRPGPLPRRERPRRRRRVRRRTGAGPSCAVPPASSPDRRTSREYEPTFLRAIGRLLHVDDDERLRGYALAGVGRAATGRRDVARVGPAVVADAGGVAVPSAGAGDARRGAGRAVGERRCARPNWSSCSSVLAANVSHVQVPLDERGDVPLTVHAKYTRREIQAAFGDGDKVLPPRWDSGVKWLPQVETDLLAFTLDKSSGDFSPTTRYRDYAISRDLIHWESQSVTSLASPTGQRYVTQAERGTKVMLFARVSASDRAFWFLGPAEVREPRRRTPDRDHVEVGAPPASRPVHRVRTGGALAASPIDGHLEVTLTSGALSVFR